MPDGEWYCQRCELSNAQRKRVRCPACPLATGAFEIVVGDRTIYSKLETGRLPNAKDVIDGLKRVGLTTPLEAKYLGTAPRSEL